LVAVAARCSPPLSPPPRVDHATKGEEHDGPGSLRHTHHPWATRAIPQKPETHTAGQRVGGRGAARWRSRLYVFIPVFYLVFLALLSRFIFLTKFSDRLLENRKENSIFWCSFGPNHGLLAFFCLCNVIF
jgi:hypothetical protein